MEKSLPLPHTFQEQRQALAHDPHRPQYHFLPPANWMNDPNGLLYWQGQYHLFYQYNPHAPYHQHIHWGHAVSDDLVHWQDWPIALAPTPDGPDKDGVWSGCAVDNNGVPTLFYSGVYPQVVCMATSHDGLKTWQKYAHNPIIASVPPSIDAGNPWEFRDPFVWQEGETWYMLMGSRIVGAGGTVLLYRSHNLVEWEYLHPLLRGDRDQQNPFWTGTIWECPNFLSFADRHVLIVSFQHHESGKLLYTGYFTGRYENHHFTPHTQHILEYGAHFYAPQVMPVGNGRYLLWGWLWEGRSAESQKEAGWAGVMSLPHDLNLQPDGQLYITPAPELQALRRHHWRITDKELIAGDDILLNDITGDALEIIATFHPTAAAKFGLKVRCSPDGVEQTWILCDLFHHLITVEREQSSLDTAVSHDVPAIQQIVRNAPLHLAPDEPIQLHIYLDRSVIELFVNGRITLSTRIYPTRPDSVGLRLFCHQGAPVQLTSLDIWQMASIWE